MWATSGKACLSRKRGLTPNKNTRNIVAVVAGIGELFEAEEVFRSLLSDDIATLTLQLDWSIAGQGRPDVAIPLLTPLVQMAGHHPPDGIL